MAGIAYWLGTTSADPTNTANWGTHSGTPANPPGAADGVLVDHRAAGPMTGAATAAALVSFVVTDGCEVNIDVSGFTVDSGATGTFQYNGRGQSCKFQGSTDIVIIEDTGAGLLEINSGTHPDVRIFGGRYQFGASSVISTLCRINGGVGTILYNATAITTLHLHAGELNLYRAVTTGNLYGAPTVGSSFCHLINRQSVDSASPTVIFTTLNNNGALIDGLSNGTITTYNGYRGAFRNQMNPWTGFTVTNSTFYQPTHYMQDSWGATGAVTYTNTPTRVGSMGQNPSVGVTLPSA